MQSELTFSDKTLQRVADRTEGFSFAYLKELCVSAMMAWMTERAIPMDKVLRRTAGTLRKEMSDKAGSKRKSEEKKGKTAAAGRELWS